MSGRVLIDGRAESQLPFDDRGLAYGDGLFETIAVHHGQPRLWRLHLARLHEGCRRLGLSAPADELLAAEIAHVSADLPAAVVRLSVTRGSGPRGYAPAMNAQARRIISASAWVPPAPAVGHGIRLRYSRTRLAIQPQLAGLKHLNRLEQVLARAEWNDPQIAEAVMLDMQGRVISATAANLFAVIDGICVTPDLSRCGVAGVARAYLLESLAGIAVRDLSVAELERADEVFLSSSLRGVVPVSQLDQRDLVPGVWSRRALACWQALAGGGEAS